MGRRGISLGNKKSVLLFAVSAYQLKIHNRVGNVIRGSPITTEVSGVIGDMSKNPSYLAPAAIGYWFWGKPYRGKL